MSVSPGVAGFDRLRSSGLYLDIGGLKPPADVLVFSVLAGRSSSTFLAYGRARVAVALLAGSTCGEAVVMSKLEARREY